MRQQINLFQPIFRQPSKIFSAVTLLQIIGVVMGALTSVYAVSQQRVNGLERRVAQLGISRDVALQKLEEIRTHYPRREASSLLRAELATQARKLEQTRSLLATLDAGAFGNPEGLSPYLEGLARQHVAGMWLTRVTIENGGAALGVYGNATKPELVPEYVARLTHESAFAGKAFSHLELLVAEPAPGGQADAPRRVVPAQVQFSITTEGLELAQEAAP